MEKPQGANESCVGPTSDAAGKADGCRGCPNQKSCASGEFNQKSDAELIRDKKIAATFSKIKRTLLVLSGKGGVGKSTCSAQLAFSLCRRGYNVGLLDIDICGPSIPLMLGLRGHEVHSSSSGWSPVYVPLNDSEGELAVMSVGFLVADENSAIIWRGPKKNGLIEQFFTSVDWGELDFLIIDTPPGTSDEHISLVQLLKNHLKPEDGAVVVSTPQEAAMMDVRKELSFCKTTKLNVIGLVENMAKSIVNLNSLSFVLEGTEVDSKKVAEEINKIYPGLKVSLDIFPRNKGGVRSMANAFNVDFLGSIPLDASIQKAGDSGKSLQSGFALEAWEQIISTILIKINISSENYLVNEQEDLGVIGS